MQTTQSLVRRLVEAGYSQRVIAEAAGVHQAQICRWAQGAPAKTADAVLRLVEFANRKRKNA